MRSIGLLAALLCLMTAPARAEVRRVAAAGNLQAAIDAAQPGDELRLAAGATFTGNFVLPVKNGDATITVRSDIADAEAPGPGQRVTPATAARFARIVSPNNSAAVRTAAGAHHWRLLLLELPANKDGYGDIVQIGDGSRAQADAAQAPYEITLDHVYVHGDAKHGQKRGIALNGRAITIRNCYISDIKAVGADAQAIAGWNGPGPFTIENNYIEASGEGFLLGGADPAIPNLVPQDVIVRYNHIARPMTWRDPLLAAPAKPGAVSASGGTLPPGRYSYRVVARRPAGQGTTASSAASPEASLDAQGSVKVTWTPVPDATEYVVYGRTAAATQSWTVTAPSFTDTGAAGAPGKLPAEATVWQVKNLFELKNARRVRVEWNVIENNWAAAQPGYAVLFTPRTQGGGCPWCIVEEVEFAHNVVRNTSAAINILGYDSPQPSRQTRAIRIHDNLFTAVTTTLGGNGWGVLLGDGPKDVVFDHNTFEFDGTTLMYVYGKPKIAGLQFTNNAAPHGTYGINGAGASSGTPTLQAFFTDPIVTGNWFSGGASGKYPGGNRFDAPFDAAKAAPAGADVARLRALIDEVRSGFISSAK